ncbi:BON domain-containing protein [Methylotenera sp.]|uniref:BON domain-containing protein n=1 Tax=Methylotenera sp. TaxID=2051956 RepID=UPI0024885A11|nr:BON domain-containing protein [Methylotenera sp.]MDI1299320.1 BON domain-containing protein [Methylotenera sp.]
MKNNSQTTKSHFKSTLLAIALASSTLGVQAFAAEDLSDANQSAYSTSFKALDTDNSTTLTKTEAKKEKLFAKHFKAADIDNDGTLDEQEYTNYKSKSEQKEVQRVVKDSVITSKVKGSLLKDEGLKSLKVSVKTNQAVVLLSGFVETEDQIKQAGKIASEIEGVKSVENSLLLKKE